MKANEFIKKYGIDRAKKLLSITNKMNMSGLVFASLKDGESLDFEVDELKRLIESHELVEKCGGLISCKKILVARIRHKPNAEYFTVHPEKPNFIQLYRRNESKLVPNYRFYDLEKAIADVESCQ
ncbi:MAG: hypothetical protein [Bacteriophage sp.]|nr:MAG: hypothetical protein [Bacteriophage sp.]